MPTDSRCQRRRRQPDQRLHLLLSARRSAAHARWHPRRNPRPDCIVIETSGVADPADIVCNLMDPVIWKEAPLETVLCVVDSTTPVAKLDDALLRSQLRAADVVALSKTDLVDAAGCGDRDAVRAVAADGGGGRCPAWLGARGIAVSRRPWLRAGSPRLSVTAPGIRPVRDHRAGPLIGWCRYPVCRRRTIRRLAPKLARAKGLFEAVEQPGRQLLLPVRRRPCKSRLRPERLRRIAPGQELCSLLKSALCPRQRSAG